VSTSVEYTSSQKEALSLFGTGQNVFLTGKPGTGKTALLEAYCRSMREAGKRVLMTASTGLAASCLTEGRTLHSVLKFCPAKKEYDFKFCAEELECVNVLVIDEASMLGGDIMQHLVDCLAHVRRNPQIIVSGDFFQLPPVNKDGIRIYPFERKQWKMLHLEPCVLTDIVRQKDPEFKSMLEKAMLADVRCVPYFNEKTCAQPIKDAIVLCTKREDAWRHSKRRMDLLSGTPHTYSALGDCESVDFSKVQVVETLVLKQGMRVMALRNDGIGRYQNGSLGTIVSLNDDSIIVQFDNGNLCVMDRVQYELENRHNPNEEVIIYQYPLCGGYACTIHKSQGQTFDSVNIDIPSCWEPGQWYVALSRARSIDGIHLMRPIRAKDLLVDYKVIDFYNSIQTA